MQYTTFCWVEKTEHDTVFVGLNPIAWSFIGMLTEFEVLDDDHVTENEKIITASGTLGSIAVSLPFTAKIVSTRSFRSIETINKNPQSATPRGGWFLEVIVSDVPCDRLFDMLPTVSTTIGE